MKEKTKQYLKYMGIAYLLATAALIFKVCRNNKINDFYTLTPETLISGTYDIYDQNINKVGNIAYKRQGEKLIVSICGDEINGDIPEFMESYNFKEIEYKEIQMEIKKYENENYYFYDTGESVIIISLLRPWFTSYSSLEKLSKKRNKYGKKKDRQTFMLINIDYDRYKYVQKKTKPTIQNYFTHPGGLGQLYRCFFIQEDEL